MTGQARAGAGQDRAGQVALSPGEAGAEEREESLGSPCAASEPNEKYTPVASSSRLLHSHLEQGHLT